MKRKFHLLIPAIAAIAMFTSCAKETPENTWPANTSSNGAIQALFAQHAPPVQLFTINAGSGGMVMGASGGKVYFGPNAFVYSNNSSVSGNVEIRLQEVYNKRDIIFSGGYTTANGLPLVSGGEINVTAWQGNQELKLAGPGSAYATIPTSPTAPAMKKFTAGAIDSDRDFTLADSSSIFPAPDSAMNPGPSTNYSYGFGLDSLDWTNCDQYFSIFYNTSAMTEFSVPLPQLFDDQNSFVLITSSYANFACRIWNYETSTHTFLCGYYKLPVGYDFTFTVVSEINGTFYYDSRTVTMTENMSIGLNPQVMPESQIIQNIGNL